MPTAETQSKHRSVYIETFGCQMNVLDTELILGALAREGYRVAPTPEEAGVVLYNTCSVRAHAEDRVYSNLGRMRGRKRNEPDLVLGVLGCMAQKERDLIFRRLPHVDLVAGTRSYRDLPRLIDEVRHGRRRVRDTRLRRPEGRPMVLPRETGLRPTRHHAFVEVMRGCDYHCSFCVVPYTRGPETNRPLAEVVDEVQALADDGVVEVTLLGQTVNAWGKRGGEGLDFADLLRALDRVRGLARIKFVTSHPSDMTERVLRAVAECERVCEWLHMPPQSGSDRVLEAMGRGYTVREYLGVVDRARALVPGCEFAGDFIVGYPGETEEDYRATERLLRQVGFQQAYVFKYSPRPGTRAWRVVDDVPDEAKQERNRRLLEAQEETARPRMQSLVGRRVEVLVDGPSKTDPGRLAGRTRGNHLAAFTADGGVSDGRLVEVLVRETTPRTLIGEACMDDPGGDPR
ncbi:MAG: tRNA (N6-isopentenyl adenosine(37)-C2)-methylthiotransferase MiaB [Planctomycetes bacterium]|nr:tRNA (N6-isopentenyl adenosine(37)-C2)-methylthiotransferase MiaB [Planctomycetota bacterium]